MVTPEEIAAEIAAEGQTVTLRRVVTGSAPVAATVKAMVRMYRPAELAAGIVQGDRRVVVAAATLADAGWPVPPRKGDQVVDGGKVLAVQGCEEVKVRDVAAKYILAARG